MLPLLIIGFKQSSPLGDNDYTGVTKSVYLTILALGSNTSIVESQNLASPQLTFKKKANHLGDFYSRFNKFSKQFF
jgi:hypothetical protein